MFGAKVPLLVRERPNILQRKKKVFILPNYRVIIFLAQSILFYKRVLFVCRKAVKMLSKYDTTSLFPFENVSLMKSGRSLTKRDTFAPNIFYSLPPPVTTHNDQLNPLVLCLLKRTKPEKPLTEDGAAPCCQASTLVL